jgi:hypothetical protein
MTLAPTSHPTWPLRQGPDCWVCGSPMHRPDAAQGRPYREAYYWCYDCEVGAPHPAALTPVSREDDD